MLERLFLTVVLTATLVLLTTNIPAQSPAWRSLLKLVSMELEHFYAG